MPVSRGPRWKSRAAYLAATALLLLPALGAGAVWRWLTRPAPTPPIADQHRALRPSAPSTASLSSDASAQPTLPDRVPSLVDLPPWPSQPTTGPVSNQILLSFLHAARDRIDKVPSYTATFRRREWHKGKLGVEQTAQLKVRRDPFSVYLRFLSPKAGKEALYVDGARSNNVLAHNGDWTRRLVPLLEVPPTSPLAMVDNRHPINEAGLSNLIDRLLFFRELDRTDPVGHVTLDRTHDTSGKEWLRSVTVMPHDDGIRPFARVEVLYCPDLQLPLRIQNFAWPADEGLTSSDPVLVECYEYDDLNLSANLTSADFDPHNPSYEFHTQ